jgi:hypothetical protein
MLGIGRKMEVMAKDLKLRTDYYLTYDFWPKGGTKVRVCGRVPAKTVWRGQRGEAVKVKDAEGNEYFIHPKAWLFDSMPNAQCGGRE